MNNKGQAIDSQGTSAEDAFELLDNLCENGFEGDVSKLALALGRDEDEINSFFDGEQNIDEDLLMKIRGIAQERGIEIE
jgi:hypothetical protein